MATSATVDTMMIVAMLATMLTASDGGAASVGADADHAGDDDGVFASVMSVLEGARHARAADARVARMVLLDTDCATPARAQG
eukprot:7722965-Pyramimonas_sp.AAC.1